MLCKFETETGLPLANAQGAAAALLRYCCSTVSYSPVWTRKNEIPNRIPLLRNTDQPLLVIPDRCISFVFFGYRLRLQHERAYIACCCSWRYTYCYVVLFIVITTTTTIIIIIIIVVVNSQRLRGIPKST